MSRNAGSLSIILVATATASLMLGAGAQAQYGAGDTGKSTQKPATRPVFTSRATKQVAYFRLTSCETVSRK